MASCFETPDWAKHNVDTIQRVLDQSIMSAFRNVRREFSGLSADDAESMAKNLAINWDGEDIRGLNDALSELIAVSDYKRTGEYKMLCEINASFSRKKA